MVLTRSMENLNLIDNNLQNNALTNNASPISTQNGLSSMSSGVNHPTENLPVANKTFLKLPQFWVENPFAWFTHIEILFSLNNIIDEHLKYQYVVVNLPEEVITKVIDIIQEPLTINKYTQIKKNFK